MIFSISFNSISLADAEGIHHLVKGSVMPRDVWLDTPGFRYIVKFNEFNQPLRKGGKILVSFLGDIAKIDDMCPVGLDSWRDLDANLRANIVKAIRVCGFILLNTYINYNNKS